MPYEFDKRVSKISNITLPIRCDTSFAQEATPALRVPQGACVHGHSITGSFEQIKRLLPDFAGEQPQPGYMLDICKTCLQVLRERPYESRRPATRPPTSQNEAQSPILPAPTGHVPGLKLYLTPKSIQLAANTRTRRST